MIEFLRETKPGSSPEMKIIEFLRETKHEHVCEDDLTKIEGKINSTLKDRPRFDPLTTIKKSDKNWVCSNVNKEVT